VSDGTDIILGLAHCASDEDLRRTVANVLCKPSTAMMSWTEVEENLDTERGTLTITLDGLQYAEAACPEGVAAMFAVFGELNNRGGAALFSLVAGDGYEPTVHFLQGHAESAGKVPAREAVVSCWIKHSGAEGAKQIARQSLAESGWTVEKWSECHEARRADYAEGTEDCDFYKQSLVDGAVFVFDEWD
jgi:hypothetical protein